MKILLADDHSVVRRGLMSILNDAYPHAEVDEVDNGLDLIKKVITQNWTIIVSDITMPGKTGLEVLHELKNIAPKTPVIILSVHTPELYAARCIKAGASSYLSKETAPEQLVTAIEYILKTGRRYITPDVAEIMANDLANKDELPHNSLSNREFEVMKLLAQGKNITEISEMLTLGTTTVSTYRARIFEKMGFNNMADVVKYCLQHQLV